MLTLDTIFAKIGDEFVELKLEDWMENSGLLASSYQLVHHVDEAAPAGTEITLPDGVYDSTKDLLMINQEGFVLIPNYQYRESGNVITTMIDIPANTNIHIIIVKLHNKLQ